MIKQTTLEKLEQLTSTKAKFKKVPRMTKAEIDAYRAKSPENAAKVDAFIEKLKKQYPDEF